MVEKTYIITILIQINTREIAIMAEILSIERFDYVNEIWGIADYVRDVIKRSEYNKIILPFSLLRRLECALEPTRDAVIESFKKNL